MAILHQMKKSLNFLQNMIVKWTKTALNNLASIADYIAEDNHERAVTFVQELRMKTQALGEFPNMGKAGRVFGTHELVLHKNYTAIYRVKDDSVQILRIHHSAMKM
jgi:addiction module RelE/StbE family toxin